MQNPACSDEGTSLSSSHEETATSSVVEEQPVPVPVCHFVADNVDHNIQTLNGEKTFHGMGMIIAKGSCGPGVTHVPRIAKPLKSSELCAGRGVCIRQFESYGSPGISTIKLDTLRSLQTPIQDDVFTRLNALWHIGGRYTSCGQPRPNWSGFMQTICQGEYSGVSTIEMLEIIDLNPSDGNCIYSTLVYISDQAKARLLGTPSITFDQPLYIKAVDIAMKAKLNIVIRLGGFHTLMSFLGSIGHLMRGSGLEEVMGLIFG